MHILIPDIVLKKCPKEISLKYAPTQRYFHPKFVHWSGLPQRPPKAPKSTQATPQQVHGAWCFVSGPKWVLSPKNGSHIRFCKKPGSKTHPTNHFMNILWLTNNGWAIHERAPREPLYVPKYQNFRPKYLNIGV